MMDPTPPISRPQTSASAIASLVCGLLGCVPFLTGLAAVILGIIGIKKTSNPMVTGRGMAIAGLILGALSLAGWAIGTGTVIAGIYAVYQTAEPARSTGEEFTRDLSEGKIDEALALAVEGTDRATLVTQSEKMKAWGAFQKLGILSVNFQETNGNGQFTIGGTATFASASKSYSMTLKKMGAVYKVEKSRFE